MTKVPSDRDALYSGILSCFFQGLLSCFSRSMASERQRRRRVPCGMMRPSMNPWLPATKGLANLGAVLLGARLDLVGVAHVAPEDDLDRGWRCRG
jgi:hypothetical protein